MIPANASALHRLVTLVAVLCLIASVSGAVLAKTPPHGPESSTTTLGQSDDATTDQTGDVVREGPHLVVTVPESNVGAETRVTVTVGGADRNVTKSFNVTDDGEPTVPWVTERERPSDAYRYAIELRVYHDGHAGSDLQAGTVRVGVDGRAVAEADDVDLRYFGFDDERKPNFDSSGTLRLPITHLVGFGSTTSVSLHIEDRSIDGVVVTDGAPVVELPARSLGNLSTAGLRNATVAVDLTGNQARYDLLARAAARSSVRTTDNGLEIRHPLLTAERYDVTVETSNPTGTYATSVTGDDGVLRVNETWMLRGDAANVTVFEDGTILVETSVDLTRDPEAVAAELGPETVKLSGVGDSFDPRDVEALFVETENGVRRIPVDPIEGTGAAFRFDQPSNLSGNVSNTLLLRMDDGSVVRAEREDGDDPVETTGDSSSDNGLSLPGGFGLLLVLVMLGSIGYVVYWTGVPERYGISALVPDAETERDRLSSGGRASGASTADVTAAVIVRDPTTGQRLGVDESVRLHPVDRQRRADLPRPTDSAVDDDGTRLRATHGDGAGQSRRVTLRDGQATVELPAGRWEFEYDGRFEATTRATVREGSEIVLEPEPFVLAVEVIDAETKEAVRDAELTVRPDGEERRRFRTDGSPVAVQLSPLARSVTVAVEHNRYESRSREIPLEAVERRRTITVQLRPRTGDMTAVVSVDETAVSGVQVTADAIAQSSRSQKQWSSTKTTDERGRARFRDCVVGDYDVTVAAPGAGRFSVPTYRVSVETDTNTRVELSVDFDFQLSPHQRERVEQIRETLSSMTAVSGRDVAIPQYYASVVDRLLTTVEELPQRGDQFLQSGVDPERLVSSLLDRADEVAEAVVTAMSSKRNTDLFSASRDLPPVDSSRPEAYGAARVFTLCSRGPDEIRRSLLDRVEDVDRRINAEQAELASVAPARELWRLVRDRVYETQPNDVIDAATLAFVYESLLDAIEQLFDETELRKRLERTVF